MPLKPSTSRRVGGVSAGALQVALEVKARDRP